LIKAENCFVTRCELPETRQQKEKHHKKLTSDSYLKMKGQKNELQVVIENQNQIIREIFDMKARIVVLEEVTNDQTNTEFKLLESLQTQRDEVQTKLEKVENSIKAIDEILKNALSENAELKHKEFNLSNITQSKSFDEETC
jgi:chromosome segregation ATPase